MIIKIFWADFIAQLWIQHKRRQQLQQWLLTFGVLAQCGGQFSGDLFGDSDSLGSSGQRFRVNGGSYTQCRRQWPWLCARCLGTE